MKKINASFRRMRSHINKIHFVDRCLLLFMLILLLQSAYSLFGLPISSGEAHTIDVIIRTSISGIFGYFLSANFNQHDSSTHRKNIKNETPTTLNKEVDGTIKNNIGFTPPDASGKLKSGGVDFTPIKKNETYTACKLQIIVATSIGLFCLIMLLLVRNLCTSNFLTTSGSSFTATVSQFRDLISGCVGFLIGCPTTHQDNES